MRSRHDSPPWRECPRCGRAHSGAEGGLCQECQDSFLREDGAAEVGGETALTVQVSPILKEALASAGLGEDFDEALLRTLKAHHPAEATALLSALTQMIEMEAERAKEVRQETIRRLAASDPGPLISLKTSRGPFPGATKRTIAETTTVRVGDKEYHSLDEVPPELRRMIEAGVQGKGVTRRVGCSFTLVGGLLAALLRLAGR